MKILESVYNSLLLDNASALYEMGGILGGKNGVVTTLFSDCGVNINNPCTYSPNVKKLNKMILMWQRKNIDFMGIYHTHFGSGKLSYGDDIYIREIMSAIPLEIENLYFPIIERSSQKVIVYVATRKPQRLEIKKDSIVTLNE